MKNVNSIASPWFLRLISDETAYSTTTECKVFDPSFDKIEVLYVYNSSHGAVCASYSITLISIKNGCMASDIKKTNTRDLLGGIDGYE